MENKQSKVYVFRCFAFPGLNDDSEGYYAVCIDAGLVTFRPTFEEARVSLNTALSGFIETASEVAENEKEFCSLIYRPLPFWPWRVPPC